MRFLPKKHFQWREPTPFLRIHDAIERAKLRWWHQPLGILIGTACLLGSWYLAKLNPQKQPPLFSVALLLALVGSAFFVYVIPWINSLCPSVIRFYDAYLARVRGNTARQVKYSEIESFSWRWRNEFATLILKHRKQGQEILVGVPPEISRDAVSQFLIDHQVAPHPIAQQGQGIPLK